MVLNNFCTTLLETSKEIYAAEIEIEREAAAWQKVNNKREAQTGKKYGAKVGISAELS